MNFGMIFVCLLIGAVVGFEFGKYMERRKIKETMKCLSDGIQEAAEKLRKLAEKQKEQTDNPLKRLGVIGFDTRRYQMNEAMWATNSRALDKKAELDMCSKLIVEMTRKGASDSEIGRVVRYSMVVIDANKLRLDWVMAKADEGIELLQKKYMTDVDIPVCGDTDGDDYPTPVDILREYGDSLDSIAEAARGKVVLNEIYNSQQVEEEIRDGERA